MLNRIWKNIGSIVISTLSLFISFLILQPFALFLDPTFNLLANRGIGKVAFVVMVIYQIFLLLSKQSKVFFKLFWKYNFSFFKTLSWIKTFFLYFSIFASLHIFILATAFFAGSMVYNPNWGVVNISLIIKLVFAFITVFFLAWTEELIFRGAIFLYITQFSSQLTSAVITSIIFMLAHNLRNPLILITTKWKLGLGLFLLGLLLNLTFILTNKLYTGIGIHAGLVFIKVLLRRAPFLVFVSTSQISPLFNIDLRQAYLIHLFFAIACSAMIIRMIRTRNPRIEIRG